MSGIVMTVETSVSDSFLLSAHLGCRGKQL